jgi:hypothetical protein
MQKTKKLKKQRKHKGKGGTRTRGGANPAETVFNNTDLTLLIKTFVDMIPGHKYKIDDSNVKYEFVKEFDDANHGLTYEFIANPGKENEYGVTLHNLDNPEKKKHIIKYISP